MAMSESKSGRYGRADDDGHGRISRPTESGGRRERMQDDPVGCVKGLRTTEDVSARQSRSGGSATQRLQCRQSQTGPWPPRISTLDLLRHLLAVVPASAAPDAKRGAPSRAGQWQEWVDSISIGPHAPSSSTIVSSCDRPPLPLPPVWCGQPRPPIPLRPRVGSVSLLLFIYHTLSARRCRAAVAFQLTSSARSNLVSPFRSFFSLRSCATIDSI